MKSGNVGLVRFCPLPQILTSLLPLSEYEKEYFNLVRVRRFLYLHLHSLVCNCWTNAVIAQLFHVKQLQNQIVIYMMISKKEAFHFGAALLAVIIVAVLYFAFG